MQYSQDYQELELQQPEFHFGLLDRLHPNHYSTTICSLPKALRPRILPVRANESIHYRIQNMYTSTIQELYSIIPRQDVSMYYIRIWVHKDCVE